MWCECKKTTSSCSQRFNYFFIKVFSSYFSCLWQLKLLQEGNHPKESCICIFRNSRGGKKTQHSGHILTWKSELILCVSTIYFFNANKINHYLNSYLKIFCSNKPKNNYVTVNLLPKDQRNLTLQAVFPKIPDTVPSIWWKKWNMCYIAKESHHIQNVKYWI